MSRPYTIDEWGETFIAVQRMKRTELLEYARRLELFATHLLISAPIEDIIAFRLSLKNLPPEAEEDVEG